MAEWLRSFCRMCINQCAIEVDVEEGVVRDVRGDTANPLYGGYSCVKGRSQWSYLASPDRLLGSLKREQNGRHAPVSSDVALDEIARKLASITAEHGPRAVAGYTGTMAMVTTAPTAIPMFTALLDAIGTPMRFDPNSIDKGGKQTAQSFLGRWQAPSQGFDDPRSILLIGINPWITHTGFPAGSPQRWLSDRLAEGCRLVVIDPRESHVATRADVHLAIRPGTDVSVLAAMISVLLAEQWHDRAFVAEHVTGLDRLRTALRAVDIPAVCRRADIEVEHLITAIRTYACAERGFAMAGTGPNMSGRGTLVEYLVLVLETLCGRWLRAGEEVRASPTLLPAPTARAQAVGPDDDWACGEHLRVRGLRESRAGMPTAALPEEILTPGPGQVRALVSWGGNPAIAFPDQATTVDALRSLELFVQVDPWYSESARLADYVLAPTMPLEVPSTTAFLDALSGRATGYGLGQSYAQYSPAVARVPEGSDLVEEWRIFDGLLRRLGHRVAVRPFGHGPESALVDIPDGLRSDELLELLCVDPRVPLSTVKGSPGGALFPQGRAVVQPGDPATSSRLDVGSPEMLQRLADDLAGTGETLEDANYPFRLICRRESHVYNTSHHHPLTDKGRPYNPAFLNPKDMAAHGVEYDDNVVLTSRTGSIRALARPDPRLRRGLVSMAFGFGTIDEGDPSTSGSSPSRLVSVDETFDPYTGQPRMSNVPIRVERASES